MAFPKATTRRTVPHLPRPHLTWTPATGDLGPLAKFFDRRDPSAFAQAVRPVPARPMAGAMLEIA